MKMAGEQGIKPAPFQRWGQHLMWHSCSQGIWSFKVQLHLSQWTVLKVSVRLILIIRRGIWVSTLLTQAGESS